jgi:hypothetical protein
MLKRQQAKLRLLSNLQRRTMDEADGREWYRLIDWLMKLPEEMDRQVHQELYRQHTEEPMKYVSFAERSGIEQGEIKRARTSLKSVLEAKFGAEGLALFERLGEITDLDRLDALTRAAAVALSPDQIRDLFEPPNGKD